ncbi:DUF4402 domain-containing protein [Altererythrobacter sp. MF3-039]|uniref:DUF4402 domain-containing protein n=1 Tax=Altererythrobacter sp. MF3-039 TaxID=3252901 RepID=UPI00390C46FC
MRSEFATSRRGRLTLRAFASIWFCAFFAALLPNPAFAQSQRSVDVRLAIFGELTITKVADMDFGNLVETGGGTVVMTATSSPSCSVTGSVLHSGACQPAEFGGKGETGRIVRIKKPPSSKITLTGPGADMEIVDLIIDGSPALSLIQQTSGYSRFRIDDPTGIFDFRLGGTLNVGATQTPGVYTGTFEVTIQYN